MRVSDTVKGHAAGYLVGALLPGQSLPLTPPIIVLATQLFAPTSLVVSFERNGPGAFSREELDQLVVRDESGRVTALQLPPKTVWVANHQVRAVLKCLSVLIVTNEWLDVRGLVVRMVSDILRWIIQGRGYRLEEESQVAAYHWMGKASLGLSCSKCSRVDLGHATLQFHFPESLMGFRPAAPRQVAFMAQCPSREAGHSSYTHLVP